MEVAILHPSHHHAHMDPSFVGQTSNMFLTGLGGQPSQDKTHTLHSSTGSDAHSILSPSHTDYSDDIMDSPDLRHVSWEDFAATSWEQHARMLEGHGGIHQGQNPAVPLPIGQLSYASLGPRSGFRQSDQGLHHAHGPSPMDYTQSASASPAPELIGGEPFTSPLTPASFDPESQEQNASTRNQQQQSHHRHPKSTPSPNRSQASSEVFSRKPGSSSSKTGASRVVKAQSPKSSGPTSAPNARSAHSAIERKYRENINNKIAELHKVLCTAGPAIFPDQETETSGYPYSRLPRNDEDDFSGVESGSASGQTVLPAKKADVLAGAIAYVRRSEKEKKLLVDQLHNVTRQLHHMEAIMQGRNPI